MRFLFIAIIISLSINVNAGTIRVDSIHHLKLSCDADSNSYTTGAIYTTLLNFPFGSVISWTGPNSYTATTGDITGLVDIGEYEITVKWLGVVQGSKKISLGYSTLYGFAVGSEEIISGNSINIKNTSASNSWCRGAGSHNLLAANTDGWIEYKATSTNRHRLFGLSSYAKTSSCWGQLDYGVYLKNNGNIVKVVSGGQTNIGTYVTGDLIRVSREGTTIKFYQNGIDLGYSVTSGVPTGIMHADVSIYDSQGSIDNMACSFKPPMEVTATITNIECGETSGGEIALNPCDSSYTYSWSPGGQTTATISNLSVGTNTVTITDGNGWVVKKSYSVGYDVRFMSVNNASFFNYILTKTSGGSAWNSGGNSGLKVLANNDAWIEYEIVATDKDRVLGFTESPVSTHPNTSIDYGVRLNSDSSFVRTQSGVESIVLGTIKKGDILKIERVGTNFNYYVNGFKYGPVTISAGEDLFVEAALYHNNGMFENVRTSINCPAYITNVKGVLKARVKAASSLQLTELNVRFNYYEKYHVNTDKVLSYKIYDENQNLIAGVDEDGTTLITGSPTQDIAYGFNACELDLTSLSLTSGEYILEVVTPKNDKSYLRFKL